MVNKNGKRIPLSKDAEQLIKGVIIGKVLTLLVIGGLLWWLLKPRIGVYNSASFSSGQGSGTASVAGSNFQTVTDIPAGSFSYGGSNPWAPIRQLVDSQIQAARPELQLRYIEPMDGHSSSSSGIRMLLDGQLDFVQSSRPLTDEEYAAAQEQGFALEQRPVGIDGIAVVVNPSLQVPGLTVDQLQQIYEGQIANWSQVGGPDLAIIPFSLRPEDTDAEIFSAQSESQQPQFGSNVEYVDSTTKALRRVSRTPGGLYYASASAVVPQCSVKPLPLGRTPDQFIPPYRESLVSPQQCPGERNQLNLEAFANGSYPLKRKLFVIIKQNEGREQQVGEAYAKLLLTNAGQNAIEQAGFESLASSN